LSVDGDRWTEENKWVEPVVKGTAPQQAQPTHLEHVNGLICAYGGVGSQEELFAFDTGASGLDLA